MSDLKDFIIKDGVLKKYKGTDETVVIPDSVTDIGKGAFENCETIKEIKMSDNVVTIGTDAFYGCWQLEKITLSKNLTSIARNAFHGCESLIEITIPEKVEKIEEGTFLDCSALQKITMTEKVSKIQNFAMDYDIPICAPIGSCAHKFAKKNDIPFVELVNNKKLSKSEIRKHYNYLFDCFLSGADFEAKEWKEKYLDNEEYIKIAGIIVWQQGPKTFVPVGGKAILSNGKEYIIGTEPIKVANPIEMDSDDLALWQKYFISNGINQPFDQLWEPVYDPKDIKVDRYKGNAIPYFRFKGKEKHGINIEDTDFHNHIEISFIDCTVTVTRIDFERHKIDINHRFEVESFTFSRFTRYVNHIIGYLDCCVIYNRILKDDDTVADSLSCFTLAQISKFIKLAAENKCNSAMAVLIDYKNKHFADFDPMDEFVLE